MKPNSSTAIRPYKAMNSSAMRKLAARRRSASRSAPGPRQRLLGFAEDIAGTAQRVDQRRAAVRVDLLAQAADVDVDDVAALVAAVVPHRLEHHGAGQHLAGVAEQVFQQAEFA